MNVERWRRYGKDRLYVTATDGTRLGWHDLITGDSHLDDGAQGEGFHAAIAAWQAEQAGAVAPSDPEPGPGELPADAGPLVELPAVELPVPSMLSSWGSPPAVGAADGADLPEPAGEDLACRRAGQMAREQALALRQAAPVRTTLARILRVHTDERAWRIGAAGEEKVAAQLAKLTKKDPRWRHLHAIPVGDKGSDIDHLVIGPGGVYTLNAKHHPGATVWVGGNSLLINGQYQPYLRNSRHEANRASQLLTTACGFPVLCIGIVVPVGADKITIKTAPSDVHVVTRNQLAHWLRGQREVLDQAAVAAVYDAARQVTTWLSQKTTKRGRGSRP